MAEKCVRKTRRKLVLVILLCGALIFMLIMVRGIFLPGNDFDLNITEGREAYLNSLGWQIDSSTESFRTVIVPDKLDGIMAQYNRMQQSQGYDLSMHLGESCNQYTYELTNYTGYDGSVLVTLYIQNGELIAADIHSTAANGFMHGLKENKETKTADS